MCVDAVVLVFAVVVPFYVFVIRFARVVFVDVDFQMCFMCDVFQVAGHAGFFCIPLRQIYFKFGTLLTVFDDVFA